MMMNYFLLPTNNNTPIDMITIFVRFAVLINKKANGKTKLRTKFAKKYVLYCSKRNW